MSSVVGLVEIECSCWTLVLIVLLLLPVIASLGIERLSWLSRECSYAPCNISELLRQNRSQCGVDCAASVGLENDCLASWCLHKDVCFWSRAIWRPKLHCGLSQCRCLVSSVVGLVEIECYCWTSVLIVLLLLPVAHHMALKGMQ